MLAETNARRDCFGSRDDRETSAIRPVHGHPLLLRLTMENVAVRWNMVNL